MQVIKIILLILLSLLAISCKQKEKAVRIIFLKAYENGSKFEFQTRNNVKFITLMTDSKGNKIAEGKLGKNWYLEWIEYDNNSNIKTVYLFPEFKTVPKFGETMSCQVNYYETNQLIKTEQFFYTVGHKFQY